MKRLPTAMLAMCLTSLIALLAVPAVSQQTQTLALGNFEWEVASNGILVTAPHGTFDHNTAAIAVKAAKHLKAGYVVARGFNPGVRINVSRPTEGSGLACNREQQTGRAHEVYLEYDRLVALASGGTPQRLYIEVHGNARAETSGNVEIATKGISADEAAQVKAAFPAFLNIVKMEWPSYPALQLLIEPVDRVYWTAMCAKRIGTMVSDKLPRALHFEFLVAAREEPMIRGAGLLAARIVEKTVR
jgi:hypothetical protein